MARPRRGRRIERTYDKPGEYSEILKVVDAKGNVDYDFAVVLVIDRKLDGKFSPTIHASYAPTLGIRPGDPITFKVRTFFADASRRNVGLRRRQPAGKSAIRCERQSACAGRLC